MVSEAQVQMYKRILEAMDPLVQVKGFGNADWTCVALLTPYGYSFH